MVKIKKDTKTIKVDTIPKVINNDSKIKKQVRVKLIKLRRSIVDLY